jgi:DNA-binding response OmpR family regulator
MHVLLAIHDPKAAATAARALRKNDITVDVAMNTRIASAMATDGSYDIVVFEQGLAPQTTSRERHASVHVPAMLEITASEAADPSGLVTRVRASSGARAHRFRPQSGQ